MTYPYFKIVTYGNWREVELWAAHFKGLDIPYAITRQHRGNGSYDYALWRVGQEAMMEYSMNPPNSEPIDGELVVMYGGFEKYLEVENALPQL